MIQIPPGTLRDRYNYGLRLRKKTPRQKHADLHGSAERNPVAIAIQPAIRVLASVLIIDRIAITDVTSFACAIRPDRVLDVAWEDSRKRRVELAGIDSLAQDR